MTEPATPAQARVPITPTEAEILKPAQPEPAKECCKCAAYREIINEQAKELATIMVAIKDAAFWGNQTKEKLDKILKIKK